MRFLFTFKFGNGKGYIEGFRGLRGITYNDLSNILKNGMEPREPLINGNYDSVFSRFSGALVHYFGIKVGFGLQTITKNKFNAVWWATKSLHFSKKLKKDIGNGIFDRSRLNVVFNVKIPTKKLYGIQFWYPNDGKDKKILKYPIPFLGNFTIFGKIEPEEILSYEVL